mgnify:CR=1 FL=1
MNMPTDRPLQPAQSGTAATFEVDFNRYLDKRGKVVVETLPGWAREPEVMLPLYRLMCSAREFDRAAMNLQRTGRLGTFASPLGQEAIGAGVASCMHPEDVLIPSYREFGAQIGRGVSLLELLLYWGGDERGSDFAGPREDFPVSIPVASHCCHAAGVAYAFKLRQQARVAVCFLGDGATSKGDFYESLNAAGAWKLPLVFVVSNNQWAISVPLQKQTAAQTLAQKAIAAGIPGEQLDGNDALAVRARVGRAIEAARAGQGPCLIEALTYRMGDHTTADDASRYRQQDEVERQRQYDPLDRLRAYLVNEGMWSAEEEAALLDACKLEMQQAVEAYLEMPPQSPESMFDFLYSELPESLQSQRRELLDAARSGDLQEREHD